MFSIGIVGRGFVGSAVAHGFSEAVGYKANIYVYDKDPSRSQNSLEELVGNSDFIFVSVPTPSNKDGSINTSILLKCVEEISNVKTKNRPIILLRSTIVPGTSQEFANKFPGLRFVFNPEFLTERSANFDFLSQTRYVLGGNNQDTSDVAELYRDRFGQTISVIETDFQTAELIKYVCNAFFATKVSFLNEMKQLSERVDADWSTVIEGFVRDGRVGSSHTNVPGHDGKLGFGGSCFPKDVQALINFCENNSVNPLVLRAVWEKNLEVRPEKDWGQLKGRAVTED